MDFRPLGDGMSWVAVAMPHAHAASKQARRSAAPGCAARGLLSTRRGRGRAEARQRESGRGATALDERAWAARATALGGGRWQEQASCRETRGSICGEERRLFWPSPARTLPCPWRPRPIAARRGARRPGLRGLRCTLSAQDDARLRAHP